MEQVGVRFEGANMESVLKYCESVSKQSRQDISNPLACILESYERIMRLNLRGSSSSNSKIELPLCVSASIQRQKLLWDRFHSGQGPTRWVSSPNHHTMTRSTCWGRVEHLQIRNHHFYEKRKSRGSQQNTGNV